MRFFIFFSIIALVNYFVVAGLFDFATAQAQPVWKILLVAVPLFIIEMLDLRTTFFQTRPNIKLFLSAVTGTFLSLFFFIFIADIVLLICIYLFPDIVTPQFYRSIFWAIMIVTAASVILGIIQAKLGPIVKQVSVSIKNLPAAFENYKIVQISDLHVGGTIRRNYVQNVVNLANTQNADLLALTGDFADGSVAELQHDSALLKDLKSNDGLYFVTGNHEYYHDIQNWLPFYQSIGFNILSNRHEIITRGEDKLVIAGVTDYSTRNWKSDERSDISKAASGMPQEAVKILLMHQPTQYKQAADAGFDLQLSGHTHGGQFFPWTLVIPLFHKFYKGLGRYNDLQVYVNVGTGYWGPALRTFDRSEITVLTLKKA